VIFFEHVALGLMVRSAYKFVGGWNWADWTVTGESHAEAVTADDMLTPSGPAANAKA